MPHHTRLSSAPLASVFQKSDPNILERVLGKYLGIGGTRAAGGRSHTHTPGLYLVLGEVSEMLMILLIFIMCPREAQETKTKLSSCNLQKHLFSALGR